MVLTGRMMKADEAERCGLVSAVVDDDQLIERAVELAKRLAGLSAPVGASRCVMCMQHGSAS